MKLQQLQSRHVKSTLFAEPKVTNSGSAEELHQCRNVTTALFCSQRHWCNRYITNVTKSFVCMTFPLSLSLSLFLPPHWLPLPVNMKGKHGLERGTSSVKDSQSPAVFEWKSIHIILPMLQFPGTFSLGKCVPLSLRFWLTLLSTGANLHIRGANQCNLVEFSSKVNINKVLGSFFFVSSLTTFFSRRLSTFFYD